MADVDAVLAQIRALLGTGDPPAWPQRTFGGAVTAPPAWKGAASDQAHIVSDTLNGRRQSLADAYAAVGPLLGQAAQVTTGARGRVDAITNQWQADKTAFAPIANTPAGKTALLNLGNLRIGEAGTVLQQTQAEFTRLAGGVYGATGKLPQSPGGTQALGWGQTPAPLAPGGAAGEADRRRNETEAFRRVFGRDPVSPSDWTTAAALDPHSYNPKNKGVPPNIVVARINPVPGQGVVRTNLFIPSEDVWAPVADVPPWDFNLGDNRGFSSTAGPEDARVVIYTDYDNGIIVARQNPSVNADTGQVQAGIPEISAIQQPNGSVFINYNTADPFSLGGEDLAKAIPISVNGNLAIAPTDAGPIVGAQVTTFPAVEIYSDRGGVTSTLAQAWPTLFDNAAGPVTGLPFAKQIGDGLVITSFNSTVPQLTVPDIPGPVRPAPIPIAPPISIIPPGNLTPFGPATDVPQVRIHTPTHILPTVPLR